MNILAIDYGIKRIGLAWVESGLGVVLPFGVIDGKDKMKKIISILHEEHIDKIIIGFPINSDGSDTNVTSAVDEFIVLLESQISISIERVDERFTTAQAKRMGGDATMDEKAAMLILQSYIDRR